VPFHDEGSAVPLPQLYQLARLLDDHQTAVVAVVDTNTARLFLSRIGRLDEVEGPDEDSVHHRKRSTGGWSQARYQRPIDKHHADFAGEAAEAIERLVDRHETTRVVLAGDEVAMTPLMAALSDRLKERGGDLLRVDIRAARDDVAAELEPVLRRMEAAVEEGLASGEPEPLENIDALLAEFEARRSGRT
jgi:hypothetical protein